LTRDTRQRDAESSHDEKAVVCTAFLSCSCAPAPFITRTHSPPVPRNPPSSWPTFYPQPFCWRLFHNSRLWKNARLQPSRPPVTLAARVCLTPYTISRCTHSSVSLFAFTYSLLLGSFSISIFLSRSLSNRTRYFLLLTFLERRVCSCKCTHKIAYINYQIADE